MILKHALFFAEDPDQKTHLETYGMHCIAGTEGSKFAFHLDSYPRMATILESILRQAQDKLFGYKKISISDGWIPDYGSGIEELQCTTNPKLLKSNIINRYSDIPWP